MKFTMRRSGKRMTNFRVTVPFDENLFKKIAEKLGSEAKAEQEIRKELNYVILNAVGWHYEKECEIIGQCF